MVAAAAAILNAVKKLTGLTDDVHMISPTVLSTLQDLKTNILNQERASLNCEEVITALTISAAHNSSAQEATASLTKLNGCRAHCTAILSDKDENTLTALGIDVTSDPEYITTNLYFG